MKLYKNFLKEYKEGLTGYSAIAIIGQSCLGSVAVMFLLITGTSKIEMIQLFFVTVCCMGYNGAVLAQLKAKTSFNILIISVLTSVSVLIINLI